MLIPSRIGMYWDTVSLAQSKLADSEWAAVPHGQQEWGGEDGSMQLSSQAG